MNRKVYLFIAPILFSAGLSLAQHNLHHDSDQDIYDRSLKLFEAGHYNASIRQFDRLPENSEFSKQKDLYQSLAHLRLFHAQAEKYLEHLAVHQGEPLKSLAYYDLGNYYFHNDNFAQAAKNYAHVDESLLNEADLTELRFKLAYSYFTRKEFREAKPHFYNSKIHHSKYEGASTYYLAYIEMELRNWKQALGYLDQIDEYGSYKNIVPALMIKCKYKLEQYEAVITDFKDNGGSKGRLNGWKEASMYAGASAYALKDYENALSYYELYLNNARNISRENHFRVGMCYFQTNKYQEAAGHFKYAAFPDDSLGQVSSYYLGMSHAQSENQAYAMAAFKHAASLEFNTELREEALMNWAKTGYEEGNISEAIIALRTLVSDYPESHHLDEANQILSQAYFESENYYDALVYLESVRNKTEQIKRSYQFAAYMLTVKQYNCHNMEDAELYLDKAFNYPLDKEVLASSYYLKGELLSRKGAYNRAILAYSGVFQSNVSQKHKYYLKTRYGIAYAYYNHKEYDKARGHFNYVINNATEPYVIDDSRNRVGDCHYIKKKYKDASEAYGSVSKYNLDYAYYHKGLMDYLASDFEVSKLGFKRLITDFPRSGYVDNAIFQLGIIALEKSNYSEAARLYSKLIQDYPGSDLLARSLTKRALSYMNLNQLEVAEKDYISVVEQYTQSPAAKDAIYGLQEVLAKNNKSDQFDAYLKIYKTANPEGESTEKIEYENAKNLLFASKYDQAIKGFESFLKSYPESYLVSDARYYLAESYRYYGKLTDAARMYEEVIEDKGSFFVRRALSKVSDLYFEQEDYRQAISSYKRLLANSRKNKDIVKANFGMAQSYFQLKQYDLAISSVNEFVDYQALREGEKYQLMILRGKSYMLSDRDSLAINDFKQVSKQSEFQSGAEAMYYTAQIQNESTQYMASTKTIRNMRERFKSFDYWVARGFILIAQNYIALNEVFQAKATLNSVIENTTYKEVKKEARNVLNSLEQSVEAANMPSDTTLMDTTVISTPKVDEDELD